MYPIQATGAVGATVGIAHLRNNDGAEPVALSERAMQAYAASFLSTAADKSNIMQRLDAPGLSDPAELQRIQERVAQYSLDVSMLSTVSRKFVSVAETLLRA